MEVDEELVSTITSHRNMIDHVFLPRKLPGKPLDLHNTESNLLESITTVIESLESEAIPSAVQRLFTNMRQLHCIDELRPKAISEQMKKLKMGEMLGIYVREQNCGLFIHMASDDEVTISTFSASLPNEMVYGSNINGDIQVRSTFEHSCHKLNSITKIVVLRLIIRRVRSMSNHRKY